MFDWDTFAKAVIVISAVRFTCAGAYQKSLAKFPCLFTAASVGLPPIVRRKLHESLWYTLWHSLSFAVNLRILLASSWLKKFVFDFDYSSLYRDFGSHALDADTRFYYTCSLAFWTSCMFYLGIETRRKDFAQMVIHHILTVSLVAISLHYNLHRFGLVVLLLHDVVDIFLYAAKSFIYTRRQTIADILFGCFALVFFTARILLFPIYCVLPAYYGYYEECFVTNMVAKKPTAAYLLATAPLMLSGLYVLQLFWWVMITKLIKQVFSGAPVDKDSRSDEEKED